MIYELSGATCRVCKYNLINTEIDNNKRKGLLLYAK